MSSVIITVIAVLWLIGMAIDILLWIRRHRSNHKPEWSK